MAVQIAKAKPYKKNDSHKSFEWQVLELLVKKFNEWLSIHVIYFIHHKTKVYKTIKRQTISFDVENKVADAVDDTDCGHCAAYNG